MGGSAPVARYRAADGGVGLTTVDDSPKIVDNEAADDVEIADMKNTREFLLPFGIDLRVEAGIASIESDLPEALPSFSDPVENGRIVGVVEGVEQLLLSLARVGIDLSNPLFAQAINDCVANLQSG
ncbi:hypothetical protein [Burkholderia territorii]|uniref:hypothetical protein n=1 Tax=Burkholderia territorii TaxID=1503055 RepID=UPI001E40244F|nr:hypothetical protein [Burkholderia territorii]